MKSKKKNYNKQNKISKKVIPFRQSLFWDVDPKTIDVRKHAVYIIERIMDFGNDREVRWMWHRYSQSLLRKVAKSSRVLQPQSRVFWQLLTKQK
jgi:hypothetical protein